MQDGSGHPDQGIQNCFAVSQNVPFMGPRSASIAAPSLDEGRPERGVPLGIRRLRVVALLLAAWLVASCSPPQGEIAPPNDIFETLNDVLALPSETQHQERWEAIEEDKRVCMNEAGFEYIPHAQPRFAVGGSAISARSALISEITREWVEANGYGLTARLIESNAFNDSDPNLTTRRALDPGDAESYEAAFSQCAIQAQAKAGFDEHYVEMATELGQLVAELEAEIISDPRLEDATHRWAECMDRGGRSYQRLSEPRDEIAERLHETQEEKTEEAEASYEDILMEEVALATADLDCRIEAGADEILSIVMKEADADFADQHRALLEEYYATRHGS